MPWMIPTAIVGGSVIGSLGAGSAAKTQANATTQGIGEQRREFDITRADTAPYRDAGTGALAQLQAALGMKGPDTVYTGKSRQELSDIIASLKQQGAATKDPLFDREIADATTALNSGQNAGPGAPNPGDLTRKFTVSDFWNDPVVQLGYQSGLDLGTKALKNAAPLTTGLDSGAALKELTQFGTDYTGRTMAAGSQARFVNDQGNVFNKLAALAGIGQTGVNTAAASGANTANNVSQMITGQGNAAGAAKIAGANAWGGGLNSIANFWNSQNMLNSLRPSGVAVSGGGVPAGGGWNTSNDWRM
jgi:hypothetical protein